MASGTVAITGANSAVGTALLARVADQDALAAVALVRRPEARDGLPAAPCITVEVTRYDEPERLTAALSGADSVVHLAGILFESPTTRYETANVEATRALVAVARGAAVGHVVFVSSLDADPRSTNGYFRSKGEAERLLAESGLDAAIIRTPLLLGPDTAGGRALRRAAAQRSVRVLGGGVHTLRPLDVDDLCDAVLRCCAQPAAGVQTHELVGPEPLRYRELLERTAALLGHEIDVRSTPVLLARLGAGLTGLVRTGGMTRDVIDVITSDESVERNADGDLGIQLTPLSDTLSKLCGIPAR
ncbi:MAG: NAD(P)H-binding protein [Acidobacteria bacterium]|nr:NAD(P)H-binding protein [Acidobacteriota bacterium]